MTWHYEAGDLQRLLEVENAIEERVFGRSTLPSVATSHQPHPHSLPPRESDACHTMFHVEHVGGLDTSVRQSGKMEYVGATATTGQPDRAGRQDMDTQATQALRVEGLTVSVSTDALREAVTTLVAQYLADNSPTQVDDDHIESIATSVVEDKMPSGYDDPTEHYDMSDYVTTDNVTDYVRDVLNDDDSLAHGDDLRETDEKVTELTERIAKMEARWTALITALIGTTQVEEVA